MVCLVPSHPLPLPPPAVCLAILGAGTAVGGGYAKGLSRVCVRDGCGAWVAPWKTLLASRASCAALRFAHAPQYFSRAGGGGGGSVAWVTKRRPHSSRIMTFVVSFVFLISTVF